MNQKPLTRRSVGLHEATHGIGLALAGITVTKVIVVDDTRSSTFFERPDAAMLGKLFRTQPKVAREQMAKAVGALLAPGIMDNHTSEEDLRCAGQLLTFWACY